MANASRYRAIGDYALIGDAHTAALVATDGSIDWCCWPRFDSGAVFCRVLDANKGGWFRVGPTAAGTVSRAYVGDTNVLATTFTTESGQVRITDCMPVESRGPRGGNAVDSTHEILRIVEGLVGEVELTIEFRPTFDFGRVTTALIVTPTGGVGMAGPERLVLTSPVALEADARGALVGRIHVRPGERLSFIVAYTGPGYALPTFESQTQIDLALQRTLAYWEHWSNRCTYEGPYATHVRRSALVLKLLTFEPTGALVAAPTTSLPEEIGGARNWDYRFTWLRDSSLILYALMSVGYHDEAADFFAWLERLCLGCHGPVQILYAIDGSADLGEIELDHLEGYRASRPVRIGNGAATQTQLDVYGEVLDAAHLCFERIRPLHPSLWTLLCRLANQAAARWREPDQGIWEVRSGAQHFVYSKLLCWVALDRAVRLTEAAGVLGDVAAWRRTRDEIRDAILAEGYSERIGAFTQAFGSSALDASALAIPLVGFLPATDPRVQSTVSQIQKQLMSRGLVYRYLLDDGLPGSDATFALCSFWLVDNLALAGKVDEARQVFDRVVGYANDVGLLSEEIDPLTGELLGNFPQGFTHLALIRSAVHIAKAERTGAEEGAKRPAERQHDVEQARGVKRPLV